MVWEAEGAGEGAALTTRDSQRGCPLRVQSLLWGTGADVCVRSAGLGRDSCPSPLPLQRTPPFRWVQPTWNKDYISQTPFQLGVAM